MKTAIGIMLWAALLAGCWDGTPSSGRCTGTIGTRTVDLPMDSAQSEFHREDDILLDDDGPMHMSYGSGALVVEGGFDDMPDERVLGTYAVPDGRRVDVWNVTLANPEAPAAREHTLTVNRAGSDRVAGRFVVRFADESAVSCTFDLRRAYELDTDD